MRKVINNPVMSLMFQLFFLAHHWHDHACRLGPFLDPKPCLMAILHVFISTRMLHVKASFIKSQLNTLWKRCFLLLLPVQNDPGSLGYVKSLYKLA